MLWRTVLTCSHKQINIDHSDPGRDVIEVASLEDGTRRRLLGEEQVAEHEGHGVRVESSLCPTRQALLLFNNGSLNWFPHRDKKEMQLCAWWKENSSLLLFAGGSQVSSWNRRPSGHWQGVLVWLGQVGAWSSLISSLKYELFPKS